MICFCIVFLKKVINGRFRDTCYDDTLLAYCLSTFDLVFLHSKTSSFPLSFKLLVIEVMSTFGRDLHNNKLTGPIPPQIGRLKRLKILYEFSTPS